MSTTTIEQPALGSPSGVAHPRGELALVFQEAFTAAVRLRASRQVALDAASFRAQIKHLLAAADRDARRAGYSGDSVRLAVYAFIAFLDESVLNSGQAMFADWPRQPLQEEIFGDHIAGETFYRHVQDLLARQDSEDTADILEVFELCLLLGFRGRYAAGNREGVQAVLSQIEQKIARVRGSAAELSPRWAPFEGEVITIARDPWFKRLVIAVGVAAIVAAGLFVVFALTLGSRLRELNDLVTQTLR